MRSILTKMWTGARSSCMPYPPAKAHITCLLRSVAQKGTSEYLIQKHAWGNQDIFLFCLIKTIRSDAVPMLSFGRNGIGQARAPVSRFVHMPDVACFQFTPCSPVDQHPLPLFQQTPYHHKNEKLFPMMQTARHLLTIVAVWVLSECVAQ
jgi:hypothetical protein